MYSNQNGRGRTSTMQGEKYLTLGRLLRVMSEASNGIAFPQYEDEWRVFFSRIALLDAQAFGFLMRHPSNSYYSACGWHVPDKSQWATVATQISKELGMFSAQALMADVHADMVLRRS
jgi:hypothetical protein